MSDIVKGLRLLVPSDSSGAAIKAIDEITRLRNELHIAQEWSARVIAGQEEDANQITALRAENEKLRAALKSVMIGGNSLAQIIGADHPPHGTPYGEAIAHYGSGVKYEAWCCWNSLMQARAVLEEKP